MKRSNRGLIITAIVLLAVIAVLLSGILLYAMFNDGDLSFHSGNKNQTVFDESFDTHGVSKITVHSSFGNINIRHSSSDEIRIFTKDGDSRYFSAVCENGVITVENKADKKRRANLKPVFAGRSVSSDIDIYLPENCVDKIEINSDFGNVDIDSLDNISLTADCDCGNIEADYIGGDFDLSTDMGNIEIDRINISKNSSAQSSMGNIEIENINEVRVEYETSMGDCDVKKNNSSSAVTLRAKTSMGDIEIG